MKRLFPVASVTVGVSVMVGAFFVACGDPALPHPPVEASQAELQLLDGRRCQQDTPCEVSPVLAFRLDEASLAATPPRLVRGALSPYEAGRIDNEVLPATLSAKLVPLRAEAGRFTALELLAPGAYSLSLGPTTRYSLEVKPWSDEEVWARVWPDSAASRFAVFCTPAPAPEVWACPAELKCSRVPGAPDCLLAESAEPRERLVASQLGQRWVQPTVLTAGVAEPVAFDVPVCELDWFPLLSGCARVADDRITIQSSESGFWTFSGAVHVSAALGSGEQLTLRGFRPRDEARLDVRNYLLTGIGLRARPTVFTGERLPHVIISEVMANPEGPEPQQEWVELYNDGARTVDLLGWTLRDETATVELPSFDVTPGAFVVIVADDFLVQLEPRLVPDENKVLLRVGEGGGTGLSNAGERLNLFDVGGRLQSSFPAIKAPSGKSVVRRTPDTLDEDPNGFGPHADPGASPGAANQMR